VKITRRYENDTLDDTRITPYLKMPPSEAVNVYVVFQYIIQPSSLHLSPVTVIDITERERRTICAQLDQ
jgi:hypothetical protein